jgi:hypothetical protein
MAYITSAGAPCSKTTVSRRELVYVAGITEQIDGFHQVRKLRLLDRTENPGCRETNVPARAGGLLRARSGRPLRCDGDCDCDLLFVVRIEQLMHQPDHLRGEEGIVRGVADAE